MPSLTTLTHYIEFPNLGWRFALDNEIAITDHFSIRWYGVLIAIGFMLAVIYGLYRARDFGINPDRMIDIALITTPIAFVGARLYYVLFHEDVAQYLANPLSILKIWEGGIGIYGGVIFAFVFGALVSRAFKQGPLAMMDISAMGFLIGQAFGRWGNFFNQEAFGGNTDLPWAMTGDIIRAGTHGSGYDPTLPVHPTFLYESLWCVLGFVLLHILSKRLYKIKGQIFCGYLIWYGIGRFFIESTRTDSLMIGTMKVSQLVAIVAILIGVAMLYILHRRAQALPKTLLNENETIIIPEEETDNGNEN